MLWWGQFVIWPHILMIMKVNSKQTAVKLNASKIGTHVMVWVVTKMWVVPTPSSYHLFRRRYHREPEHFVSNKNKCTFIYLCPCEETRGETFLAWICARKHETMDGGPWLHFCANTSSTVRGNFKVVYWWADLYTAFYPVSPFLFLWVGILPLK